ncbi:MAG TPA: pantoate--beta-alanine ligase, partial [Gemmataceae bacterium]|nr:pantoate--beta-alanine ligase [Gemmataceae bacterium]
EPEAFRRACDEVRARGQRVGLVPTMGALHAGHVALVTEALRHAAFVVVSVFVNPTQFGPNEDFARYPRPFERDREVCRSEGVDLILAPERETVYPEGFSTWVQVEGMQDVFEGASRPGHFRGVCTVVLKMFSMVGPDIAYFGQKDAQQVIVLKRMVRDLNVPVEVRVCPTVREADGLALSSRNVYLDLEQRRHAVALFQALGAAREQVSRGERDAGRVQWSLAEHIQATAGAVLDYAAVVDAASLRPLESLSGKILLALAVRFGATRLIDNLVLEITDEGTAEASL